jgi:UDP:flavonoid glycosyltransferase YjiC (YdhE family)
VLCYISSVALSYKAKLLKSLMNAFGRLPQRVIMKMPTVPGMSIPNNIMTVDKMPLQDVLAHPNVKVCLSLLFIP